MPDGSGLMVKVPEGGVLPVKSCLPSRSTTTTAEPTGTPFGSTTVTWIFPPDAVADCCAKRGAVTFSLAANAHSRKSATARFVREYTLPETTCMDSMVHLRSLLPGALFALRVRSGLYDNRLRFAQFGFA